MFAWSTIHPALFLQPSIKLEIIFNGGATAFDRVGVLKTPGSVDELLHAYCARNRVAHRVSLKRHFPDGAVFIFLGYRDWELRSDTSTIVLLLSAWRFALELSGSCSCSCRLLRLSCCHLPPPRADPKIGLQRRGLLDASDTFRGLEREAERILSVPRLVPSPWTADLTQLLKPSVRLVRTTVWTKGYRLEIVPSRPCRFRRRRRPPSRLFSVRTTVRTRLGLLCPPLEACLASS